MRTGKQLLKAWRPPVQQLLLNVAQLHVQLLTTRPIASKACLWPVSASLSGTCSRQECQYMNVLRASAVRAGLLTLAPWLQEVHSGLAADLSEPVLRSPGGSGRQRCAAPRRRRRWPCWPGRRLRQGRPARQRRPSSSGSWTSRHRHRPRRRHGPGQQALGPRHNATA